MRLHIFEGFWEAYHGFNHLWKGEAHFRMQAIAGILLVVFILLLGFSYAESVFIIFAVTLVLASEAVNTVVEKILDYVSTKRSKKIGIIKDVMATVVLINSIGAACIGAVTFVHYFMRVWGIGDLLALDQMIFFSLNSFAGQTGLSDRIIIFLASSSAYTLCLLFLLFLSISRLAAYQKINLLVAAVSAVIIARFGITELIRFLMPRLRPFTTHEVYQLIPEHGYSFPSGHAAFFFALSTVIFYYNKPLGICFFAASVLMGIARVTAGVHYPSDIIGGFIVGVLVAMCVVFVMKSRERV